MSAYTLSILIVSYNTADLTIQAITSALQDVQKSTKLKNKTEILVIDNNSNDNSVEKINFIARKHNNLQLIKNTKNLGFAAANNIGIEKSTGKYILLLNSDTIVHTGALEALVTTFESNTPDETTAHLSSQHSPVDRLGIVAARLINPDESSQPQGGDVPTLVSVATHLLFLDDIPILGKWLPSTQHTGINNRERNIRGLQPKGWVAGTAMVLRRSMLSETGLLDDAIFMYGEDMELCMRASNHHWDIGIQTKAVITHFGSASSSSKRAITGEFEAYQYIWAKHKPNWQRPWLLGLLKAGAIIRSLIFATIPSKQPLANHYAQIAKTIQLR